MTNDPKRWSEDDEAPAELRAYLRDASASEVTLPATLRTQVRRALLEAHALESDAGPVIVDPGERVVAMPTVPTRSTGRAVVFAMLAAAIILLGLVLYAREPRVTAPTPAVAPEPNDAGPDVPALELIEIERVCGDREDSDWQCDLVVRPSHPYERIELHAANGMRPPGCDGASEQHREPADGDQRFVLSDGASERGRRAFTVCGYRGSVLMGMGSIEGRRSFPWTELGRRRGGDDVRIPLDALDDDITRLELRWIAPTPDEDHDIVGDGCHGEPVFTVDRDELAPLLGRAGLALFRHVLTPEHRAPTFLLCAYSDAGVSHRRAGYRFPEDDQPFLRTPSGELPIGEIRSGTPALGPDGIVTVSHFDASWLGGAASRRAAERLLARLDDANVTPARELLLANGQTLILPRGARLGPRSPGVEPRTATLRDGTTTAIVSARELPAASSEDGDDFRVARNAVLTSSSEACVFLDDVLVALFATSDAAPRPIEPDVPESIRVLPQVAYECHVEVLLEVEQVPADALSVAIAYVHPRGDVDLASRPAIDCATASVAMELPVSALDEISADARGVRQLALRFSDAPDDFDDLRDEGNYCSAPYAVIACVRDASGLHALPGATGRWTHSGLACFAGDTPVATGDGSVPIASLRAGHRVLAFDANRGETTLTTVTRLIPRGERAVLTFTLSSGNALRVTYEHPLFDSRGRTFRRAATFVVGDRLRGIDGRDVVVMAIDDGDRAPVFDLSVAGPHTYFAGGIVAHNY